MSKASKTGPETHATAFLRRKGVSYDTYLYDYVEHGGATHSAEVLGLDPYSVVKTLIMQDEKRQPMVVLMHGNRKVGTKDLARQIGRKSVEPCEPAVANRHSGYLVGGTSPFGTARDMPVFMEASILELPKIAINGGRRGFLIGLAPKVCQDLLAVTLVQCAMPL